jgi:hypothetical protein
LLIARRRGIGTPQHRHQALALHRPGGPAMRGFQGRNSGEIEQRRHHVDDMAELAADRAKIF